MTGRLGGDGARFTSDITLFVHFSLFITDELSYITTVLGSAAHHDRTTLIVKACVLRRIFCRLPSMDGLDLGVVGKQ